MKGWGEISNDFLLFSVFLRYCRERMFCVAPPSLSAWSLQVLRPACPKAVSVWGTLRQTERVNVPLEERQWLYPGGSKAGFLNRHLCQKVSGVVARDTDHSSSFCGIFTGPRSVFFRLWIVDVELGIRYVCTCFDYLRRVEICPWEIPGDEAETTRSRNHFQSLLKLVQLGPSRKVGGEKLPVEHLRQQSPNPGCPIST